MYIKKVKEIPTEGQFVVVWIYEGAVWSSTYCHSDGELHDIDTKEVMDNEMYEWLEEDDKEYFIAQEYKNANK
tara:strand:+ start:1643 stop:1861 length:219 start_codon:yes stop_codon:yes gene_type:complete